MKTCNFWLVPTILNNPGEEGSDVNDICKCETCIKAHREDYDEFWKNRNQEQEKLKQSRDEKVDLHESGNKGFIDH